MKTTILKFGFYSFITATILFLAALVLGNDLSFGSQEIIGYASIIISLLFVYFGIRHFRDRQNNGIVSFRTAFIIGICISLFAGLGFAIIDYIYTTVINPAFIADYLETMKTQGGAEEIPNYSSGFLALFMFMTVTIIGIIITIISASILQRK